MKKLLILTILSLLLLGCSNFLEDETNVSVVANLHTLKDTRTPLASDDTIASIELWISNPGEDYRLVDAESDIMDYDNPLLSAIDYLPNTVRHFSSYGQNFIEFDITTQIKKVFTLRVVYESERVFIGYITRAVSSFTSEISIDIYETATSKQIVYFSELDEFLKDW